MSFDIICIGDSNVDFITQLENMPDFETEEKSKDFTISPGGNACNSCFTFAKIGLKTALVSRVGTDLFGSFLLKELKKHKINTNFIEKTENEKTGFSQIFDVNGKKAIVSDKGASKHLTLSNLPKKEILDSKILYIGGYFHLPAFQKEFEKFLQRITKLKKKPIVCFDTCFDENNRWMNAIEPLLPHIDFFFTNSNELQYLTGEREFRVGAKALVSAGAKTVIVKLGKQGSACF
ncbi:MAG: carbohydrate kinase family protein, partial [Candidatus Diapherotrites archaeon]|nr:carbohydrate kinase family protein [Candidatus Diapherotrites archaeon]